jgi:hypothetical protein
VTEAQAIVQRYKNESVTIAYPHSHAESHPYNKHEAYLGLWSEGFRTTEIVNFDDKDFQTWKKAQLEHADELATAGATYLDENYPGWRDKVSAENLDMSSGAQCILGQFFGDYDQGINEIWRRDFQHRDPWDGELEVAHDLGFLANGACYQALDEAWLKELYKR